ncbi:head-tail joining protein [Pararoseomonas indoligenes]|uniref:Uncharacterized protein n=1 Tax=Roseomonas indoligenes TaxID=2820811 RepID=A0A940MT07_9PROT|nr:hypothetical protein [Pararoseomonas indoligenes]MBP0492874.1 hypothetical protein [Pararoseomonas indoligenes]
MAVDIDALTSAALLAAFGEPIAYVPRDQADMPDGLRGIFDRTQLQVLMQDEVAPSSVAKTWLGVRQADFPPGFKHRQKDRLVVRGVTYDVAEALPDGQGWVYLELGRIG